MLHFGEFSLDRDRFQLRRNGTPLKLERKPLELLILLASAEGRLVSREEIARTLWPSEVFVDTEHGINTAIRKIRYALRETAERPRFLETVTGKGYRFAGVTLHSEPPSAPPVPTTAPEPVPNAPPDAPPDPPPAAPAAPAGPQPSAVRHLWLAGSLLATALATIAAVTVTLGAHRSAAAHAAPAHINPAAVDAYQHGRFLWFSNHQQASGAYFLKATELAPDYAPAWAGLSTYYGAQVVVGTLDPRENLPLEDAAAHRAAQLADNLAESHLALAGSDWLVNWDFPSALKELDRAIQLDPQFTEAHHLRSKLLIQLGRTEDGLAEQRLAMQTNQFERPWALANALLNARRFDAAIVEARARLEGTPNPHFWQILTLAYAAKGMTPESEDARRQSLLLSGDPAAAEAAHRAFVRGGRRGVLLWKLADLQAQSRKHYVPPYRFATVYAQLGQKPQALDALEESVRQHSPLTFDLQSDFQLDGLHQEPRYRAIVQRIGLPPAW